MDQVKQVTQLCRERTCEELLASLSLTSFQEGEFANQLFDVFESIWTSTSYNQEDETNLDYNTADNETNDYEEDASGTFNTNLIGTGLPPTLGVNFPGTVHFCQLIIQIGQLTPGVHALNWHYGARREANFYPSF